MKRVGSAVALCLLTIVAVLAACGAPTRAPEATRAPAVAVPAEETKAPAVALPAEETKTPAVALPAEATNVFESSPSPVYTEITPTPPPFYVAPTPMLENPYRNHAHWYKGQVHVHSNQSGDAGDRSTGSPNHPCADNSPKTLELVYAGYGYDFIALTDHDTITPDPGVERILHIDSEEDASSGEGPFNYFPPHILGIDIEEESDHDWSCQARIDQYTWKQNGLAVLAHPNDTIREYDDERCVGPTGVFLRDLYGYTSVQMQIPGYEEVLRQWDDVLSTRRRVWLFAADDSHCVTDESQTNHGWIVVNSAQDPIDKADVVQNMKDGNFYAVLALGTEYHGELGFRSIEVVGNEVRVVGCGVEDSNGVRFVIDGENPYSPTDFQSDSDNSRARCHDRFTASYLPDGSAERPFPDTYVRIEIQDTYGNIAYSQPLFVPSPDAPSGIEAATWQADGWGQPWVGIKGVGNLGQGAGVAITELDGDFLPEMVLMALDPNEPRFRYRIGRNMGLDGRTEDWEPEESKEMRGFPVDGEAEGADVAVTNLDDNPRPEMVFMAYFPDKFRYWIGWNVQSNGDPEAWSEPVGPLGLAGVGPHAEGAGVAFRDLDGNGRPEMVLMAYVPDEPRFRLLIGRDMQTDGVPLAWEKLELPGFVGMAAGAGIAFAFLDNDPRPEIVLMAYTTYAKRAGPNSFLYRVGWNVQPNGQPTAWGSGGDSAGCCGNEGQGAGMVIDDLDRDGLPDLILMAYDASGGENFFRYTIGWDVKARP